MSSAEVVEPVIDRFIRINGNPDSDGKAADIVISGLAFHHAAAPADIDQFGPIQAAGHERESIVADQGFADPAGRDFSLRDDSPALALGFKPFDPARAGIYGDPEWRRKADETTVQTIEMPPDPPEGIPYAP